MRRLISRLSRHGLLSPELGGFLRDFITYAGRKGIVAGVFVALGAVLEGVGLALLVPLLGIVIGSRGGSGRIEKASAAVFHLSGVESQFGQLVLLMAVYLALIGLRAAVVYGRDTRVATLQFGFVEASRVRIMGRLAATSWDQLARLRHARITHIMSGDIQRVGAAAQTILQLTVSGAVLLIQCVLVFLLSPALAAIAVLLLLLLALLFMPVMRRARRLGGALTTQNLGLLNATAQFLGGLKLAVSANLQANFVAEFRDSLARLTRSQVEFRRQQTKSSLALSTLSACFGATLLLVGFGMFQVGAAALLTMLYVIMRMSGLAGSIQQSAQSLVYMLPAYGMMRALEDELAAIAPEPDAPADASALPDGPIVFEGVSYRHSADEDDGDRTTIRGVRDLNLTIESGAFVGIAGPSGAGKTTFADLLVGLSTPQSGRIRVGGRLLEGAALGLWRNRTSYVAQDPFLFHDTVRRNLAWAAPTASEAEMWEALTLVGADTLVRQMEDGLDTVVGERGTLVSGGERQRLALARAVLRKPRLFVLDEATSAIDVGGEHDILARLCRLTPRPTIIIIAHRGESLEFCTRLLRFEAGRLVDDGAAAPWPGTAALAR